MDQSLVLAFTCQSESSFLDCLHDFYTLSCLSKRTIALINKCFSFIISVAEGSVAAANGIELGDRIVDVNGVSFLTIEHGEAVETIRRAQQLFITVKVTGDDVKSDYNPKVRVTSKY